MVKDYHIQQKLSGQGKSNNPGSIHDGLSRGSQNDVQLRHQPGNSLGRESSQQTTNQSQIFQLPSVLQPNQTLGGQKSGISHNSIRSTLMQRGTNRHTNRLTQGSQRMGLQNAKWSNMVSKHKVQISFLQKVTRGTTQRQTLHDYKMRSTLSLAEMDLMDEHELEVLEAKRDGDLHLVGKALQSSLQRQLELDNAYQVYSKFVDQFEEQNNAAIIIQKYARKYIAKKNYKLQRKMMELQKKVELLEAQRAKRWAEEDEAKKQRSQIQDTASDATEEQVIEYDKDKNQQEEVKEIEISLHVDPVQVEPISDKGECVMPTEQCSETSIPPEDIVELQTIKQQLETVRDEIDQRQKRMESSLRRTMGEDDFLKEIEQRVIQQRQSSINGKMPDDYTIHETKTPFKQTQVQTIVWSQNQQNEQQKMKPTSQQQAKRKQSGSSKKSSALNIRNVNSPTKNQQVQRTTYNRGASPDRQVQLDTLYHQPSYPYPQPKPNAKISRQHQKHKRDTFYNQLESKIKQKIYRDLVSAPPSPTQTGGKEVNCFLPYTQQNSPQASNQSSYIYEQSSSDFINFKGVVPSPTKSTETLTLCTQDSEIYQSYGQQSQSEGNQPEFQLQVRRVPQTPQSQPQSSRGQPQIRNATPQLYGASRSGSASPSSVAGLQSRGINQKTINSAVGQNVHHTYSIPNIEANYSSHSRLNAHGTIYSSEQEAYDAGRPLEQYDQHGTRSWQQKQKRDEHQKFTREYIPDQNAKFSNSHDDLYVQYAQGNYQQQQSHNINGSYCDRVQHPGRQTGLYHEDKLNLQTKDRISDIKLSARGMTPRPRTAGTSAYVTNAQWSSVGTYSKDDNTNERIATALNVSHKQEKIVEYYRNLYKTGQYIIPNKVVLRRPFGPKPDKQVRPLCQDEGTNNAESQNNKQYDDLVRSILGQNEQTGASASSQRELNNKIINNYDNKSVLKQNLLCGSRSDQTYTKQREARNLPQWMLQDRKQVQYQKIEQNKYDDKFLPKMQIVMSPKASLCRAKTKP